MDLIWIICFYCLGVGIIWHSATAVRTGIFHGWYNFTWKSYYVRQDESPAQFWFETLFTAFMGSAFIGLSTLMLDSRYDFLGAAW